jgi:hypothetical protein
MHKSILISALLLLGVVGAAQLSSAESQPDATQDAAIKKPAADYIEGWYTGNADRMESALYPELAKRMVYTDPRTSTSVFNHMGAMTLVQRTRTGIGKRIPKERQQEEITILDRFNNTAVVKIVASDWVDYLEEARIDGEWKIVNVLWELKKPMSSVRKYADLNLDVLAAGRELGVESVLEGSLQHQANRVRVTVRLLNVSNGVSLWARTFDEEMTDIFALQDVISEQVAQALSLELSNEDKTRLVKHYTRSTRAYQLYLKGRYYWWKNSPEEYIDSSCSLRQQCRPRLPS